MYGYQLVFQFFHRLLLLIVPQKICPIIKLNIIALSKVLYEINMNFEQFLNNYFIGCYRIDVFLSIRNGSKLLSISLVDAIDPNPRHWNDQLLYHMSFAYGKGSPSFTFDFVIQRDEGTSGPLADFTVIGKYIHDEKIQKTDEYQSFLAEFPAWTVMQTEGLAHYQSFVLL